jgi:hypothetical protein
MVMNQYRERCRQQVFNWAMGKPLHNRIDDECCPDFSCWHWFTDDWGSRFSKDAGMRSCAARRAAALARSIL